MSRSSTHELVLGLGVEAGRKDAAMALARHIGCSEIALFVEDPTLGILIPAAGMPKTVSGGPAWRAFLGSCRAPGRQQAQVDLPASAPRRAIALVQGGMAAVLLGGNPDESAVAVLEGELPLLAALLRAEQQRRVVSADAAEARDAASRANTLAKALDVARGSAAELNVQLRAEHERRDELLAMLAHELRNPLAPLASSIEILRRETGELPNASVAMRQLDIMTRQVGQLTQLVEDLLDMARLSRGLIRLRKEKLTLAEVLQDAIDASRPAIEARQHSLELTLAKRPIHLDADRVRLTQIFSNLLNNAAKYTPPGGRIRVSSDVGESSASVIVQDSGIGIQAAMLPRIFELFAQAPVAIDRAEGGLGIGLTLVRTLVAMHGGRVLAHSAGVGAGSTFTVELPRIAEPPWVTAPKSPVASASAQSAPLRVLVVDDNQDAATSLAELLAALGHDARTAFTSEGALQLAQAMVPELVLLDIGLPEMDGYEVARRLRRHDGHGAFLVALTGYGADQDRQRAMDAGFHEHLVKPASLDALRRVALRAGERIQQLS